VGSRFVGTEWEKGRSLTDDQAYRLQTEGALVEWHWNDDEAVD